MGRGGRHPRARAVKRHPPGPGCLTMDPGGGASAVLDETVPLNYDRKNSFASGSHS
jgi:hypothetical protein